MKTDVYFCHTELKEDHFQIPRSTSLLVRRLPPASKTKVGSASRYIAGTSVTVGGRDDTVDRRVEPGSRADAMAKKTGIAISMMGRGAKGGSVNLSKSFGGPEEVRPLLPTLV